MELTSKDMIAGPEWMKDECAEGYRDGRRADNPWPSGNRSPAYIHGFNCARLDMSVLPPMPVHKIVATWNMIVATETP